MSKIFIDPGHGGHDSGAAANGMLEKSINLIVAKMVRDLLGSKGIQVKLSRQGDIYPSLSQRADQANQWGANYFISIHHNAGGGNGYELIHAKTGKKGKQISEKIGAEFEAVGQNKRRIYYKTNTRGKDYYAVIRQTRMPAIITEFAFMDSKDADIIDTREELLNEAIAISNGILKQLNIEPIQTNKNKDNDFVLAINKLADMGVLDSPDYWLQNTDWKQEYMEFLIKKVAKFIR